MGVCARELWHKVTRCEYDYLNHKWTNLSRVYIAHHPVLQVACSQELDDVKIPEVSIFGRLSTCLTQPCVLSSPAEIGWVVGEGRGGEGRGGEEREN